MVPTTLSKIYLGCHSEEVEKDILLVSRYFLLHLSPFIINMHRFHEVSLLNRCHVPCRDLPFLTWYHSGDLWELVLFRSFLCFDFFVLILCLFLFRYSFLLMYFFIFFLFGFKYYSFFAKLLLFVCLFVLLCFILFFVCLFLILLLVFYFCFCFAFILFYFNILLCFIYFCLLFFKCK